MTDAPHLIEVRNLVKRFPIGGGLFSRSHKVVHAVSDVSFHIARGETLSLVGESGCGKSTVGKCLARLIPLTEGEITLDGQRIDGLSRSQMKPVRKRLNVVFQDPFSSLNPRMTVEDLVAEPLRSHGMARTRAERHARVGDLLEKVGLAREAMARMPHQFSGGQRQRICIARALASEPDIIICDEAVSALDVSVQAQIINLLMDLQKDLGLALLFISHDLAVVEHMSDRIAVMYLGRIMEIADRESLFRHPRHPYTRALLSAVPLPDPEADRDRAVLTGDVPSPIDPPSGCFFRTRCPMATDRCAAEVPALRDMGAGHMSACHYAEDV
ncbi:peptide/nickel transport system ATP-binding protein [Lutimaribacter pacificus]|uniref:Peptide/nickel transport system ATP-binding protein n=1 Tax=Lutimaribacter pacificus TaxID=391948 RepID=A0A1H0D6E8_9RHOB|nr:oligopeptide/dipeptide ABC transporter ATP-binding protein [Lutimaribacter pacificus]SDN65742.1 peptide/nickel transport system ATP-binding protein [Lutimaribacter pacificus]SHJ36263.1 peptide/nickel transport system ATP-binding protein [Lutimaribacter pacificus]